MDGFSQEDLQWLTEELRSELVNGGLDNEESLKIGEACAKASDFATVPVC